MQIYSAKCFLKFLFVFFFIFGLFCTAAHAEPTRKKIAVMDFTTGDIDEYASAAMYATGVMMSELSKSANYALLERSQLNRIFAEQGLSKTGAVSGQSLVQTGQLLGADYLVVGSVDGKAVESSGFGMIFSVGKEQTTIKIAARMIDARTGEIVFAEEVSGNKKSGNSFKLAMGGLPEAALLADGIVVKQEIDNAVADAVRDGVRKLVVKMNQAQPVYGSVVKLDGRKIYLNVGKNKGVQVGDIFYLIANEEVVKDPVSGRILEVIEKTGGKLKVKEVYSEVAICTGDRDARIGMRAKRDCR